jgi:hypothetical protein
MFRSNTLSVEEMAKALEILTFDVFHPENVKIVMEINFKGNVVFERMSRNREFFPEIFLYTRHSVSNETLKLGVKIQKDNKESFARELRSLVQQKRIIVTEEKTFEELSSFGVNNAGRYESQLGNDDAAMTCINLVTYFDSVDFYDMVEDMYDTTIDMFKDSVEKRMAIGDKSGDDMTDIFKVIRNFENSPVTTGERLAPGISNSSKKGKNPYMKGFGM